LARLLNQERRNRLQVLKVAERRLDRKRVSAIICISGEWSVDFWLAILDRGVEKEVGERGERAWR
jgi:hypothetical protein